MLMKNGGDVFFRVYFQNASHRLVIVWCEDTFLEQQKQDTVLPEYRAKTQS
jgi:hypothetical protein